MSEFERREKSSAEKKRRTCVPKYPLPPVTRIFMYELTELGVIKFRRRLRPDRAREQSMWQVTQRCQWRLAYLLPEELRYRLD